MKRRCLVLVGVLSVFLAMPLYAEAASVDDQVAGPADPPTAAATAMPEPVAGLTCGTQSGIAAPEALGDDARVAADSGGIPDCPATFSNCQDVLGKKCGLRSCVTVDLGVKKCRLPNGSLFQCAPATVHHTTCNCEEILFMVCCTLGNCTFGECGFCSGGSSSIDCQ